MNRRRRIAVAIAWTCCAIVVALGYAAVHGRLNLHHVDDAWSTSFAWQFIRHGITEDLIYQLPGAMPLPFGKTHAVLYAAFLEPLGWTRSHVHFVSTAVIFGAALCWTAIGRGIGLGREAAALLGASLLLFQPMVLAANLGRPDAVTLLLASATLLALVRRRWLLAGLLAMLAVENHPMGVTAFAWGLAYLLHSRRELLADKRAARRQLLRFALGVLLGAAWMLWADHSALSWQHLSTAVANANKFSGQPRTTWTYLHHYFSDRGHVELGFFLAAIAICIWRRDALPLWLLAATVLLAALVRRQSGFYVLFAFPVFALLCARAFAHPALRRGAFALLLAAFAWRCHHTWQQNKSVHFERTLAQVVAAVPQDGLPVVGLNDFWFGFKDQPRRFVPASFQGDLHKLGLTSFYLVDSSLAPQALEGLRPALAAYGPGTEIARVPDSDATQVRILRLP